MLSLLCVSTECAFSRTQTSLQDLRNALQQASTTSRTELDKALQELNMDERLSALQSAVDGRINEVGLHTCSAMFAQSRLQHLYLPV